MKKLDRTKMYNLKHLSDGQLVEFGKKANKFKKSLQGDMSDLYFLYEFKDFAPFTMFGSIGFDTNRPLSEAIDARELFFDPKQGEKVLWKGGAMPEFREGIFVTEYNGFFLIEYDGQIHYGKEIKPFVKSFKKGDWVKYKYNGEIFFTQCKGDVENNNLSLVEDLELIRLMYKNK